MVVEAAVLQNFQSFQICGPMIQALLVRRRYPAVQSHDVAHWQPIVENLAQGIHRLMLQATGAATEAKVQLVVAGPAAMHS